MSNIRKEETRYNEVGSAWLEIIETDNYTVYHFLLVGITEIKFHPYCDKRVLEIWERLCG